MWGGPSIGAALYMHMQGPTECLRRPLACTPHFQVNEAAAIIYDLVDPNANLIFGTVIDPSLDDAVSITIIATGFVGNNNEPETGSRSSSKSTAAVVRQPIPSAAVVAQPVPAQRQQAAEEDEGRYPGGIEIPAFLRRRRLQGK